MQETDKSNLPILERIIIGASRQHLDTRLAQTISDLEKIGEAPLNERQQMQLAEVIEAYALTRELLFSKVQFKEAIQQQLQSRTR